MYLKHDKTLYELTDQQAKEAARQMDLKQTVRIGLQRLRWNECELLDSMPANRDNFTIKKQAKPVLSTLTYEEKIKKETAEEKERVKKWTPEQKTEWHFRYIFYSIFCLRTGLHVGEVIHASEKYEKFCKENKKLKEKFEKIVLPFFKENHDKIRIKTTEFESLLPAKKIIKKDGFVSIGDIIKSR